MRRDTIASMRLQKLAAAVAGSLIAVAPIARGANYDASTSAFTLANGYSAVNSSSAGSVFQRTYHAGTSLGPIDVFNSVTASGGTVLHSYTLSIANFTNAPLGGYQLKLGTTTQDYYHNINIDG